MAEGAEHADWKQVGDSFRDLGLRFRSHLTKQGEAPATGPGAVPPAGNALDELADSISEAVGRFDKATNDPEVAKSANTAMDSLLAAVKKELGTT